MEGGVFLLSGEEFIRRSFEINLFFQRIMKEHLFLIETNLSPIETRLIKEATILKKSFEEILAETVILAKGNISEKGLKSKEIVTEFTLPAEQITSALTGASLNTNITQSELELTAGKPNCTEWLVHAVESINIRSMNLLDDVIGYKRNLLNLVLQCKVALKLYPEILKHLIEEAEYYAEVLNNLIAKKLPEKTLCEELNFWNYIMGEHGEFINDMLDPTEKDLKETAEEFAKRFEKLVEDCLKYSEKIIIQNSLEATEDIRDFKMSATEGLLECKIKSIIPPILADHVLREANHYLRLLKK